MKECLDCKKDISDRHRGTKRCKECYKKKNNKRALEYYSENRDKIIKYNKQYILDNPDKSIQYNWKKQGMVGMTVKRYDELFKNQEGCCAICGNTSKKRLSVDHNHETGEIRALLCGKCNTGIGQLQDNEDIVRKALEYIIKYNRLTK